MIESEIYKTGKGRFAMLLFERHGSSWLIGCVALIFVSIFLGIVLDYRIFLLALIIVCLVAPAMMMILYFNYGLKGLNYINVIDHKVAVGEGMVNITLYGRKDDAISEDNESEAEEEQSEPMQEIRTYSFPPDRLGGFTLGSDYALFSFSPASDGFLYVPVSAFTDIEMFSEFVERLAGGKEIIKK